MKLKILELIHPTSFLKEKTQNVRILKKTISKTESLMKFKYQVTISSYVVIELCMHFQIHQL